MRAASDRVPCQPAFIQPFKDGRRYTCNDRVYISLQTLNIITILIPSMRIVKLWSNRLIVIKLWGVHHETRQTRLRLFNAVGFYKSHHSVPFKDLELLTFEILLSISVDICIHRRYLL
jgi:hypothetical protein